MAVLSHDLRTPLMVTMTSADVLEISSGGPPIPESMLPVVFEPFRRGTTPGGTTLTVRLPRGGV